VPSTIHALVSTALGITVLLGSNKVFLANDAVETWLGGGQWEERVIAVTFG
jgi:hypothetical protein